MLVARFFDGVAGSAFLSVAGGTVGDMFARHELQAPMMIFTGMRMLGWPPASIRPVLLTQSLVQRAPLLVHQ